MPKQAAPKMLDLSQFASLDDAVEKVKPGDRYANIGGLLLGREGMGLTMPVLFFFSMISRCEGLHQAIAREIGKENPHAVFPLLRAFAESVTLLIYVVDHPKYIDVLTDRERNLPKGGPKRKKMQALIAYATPQASGLKNVYAELSEATHFGSLAMWASMRVENTDNPPEGTIGTFSWSSGPRWKSDEQGLIASAMTLELAEASDFYLRRFAVRHLGVGPDDAADHQPDTDAAAS